jgi:hypothetical protein
MFEIHLRHSLHFSLGSIFLIYPGLNPLKKIFWWGSIKNEVYKRKVDTPDELLARILDVVTRIKNSEDQIRPRVQLKCDGTR